MKSIRLLVLLSVVTLGSFATAACGEDDPVAVVAAPGAPTGVAVSVNATTMTLTWTASARATSYRAVLTSPGETDRTVTASTTTAEFTSLTPGSTYAAQVFAINSAGEAGSSVAAGKIAEAEATFIEIAGDIVVNTTWTSDKIYVLKQPTFVGVDCGRDGAKAGCIQATLTIQPGTTILGKTSLSQGVRGAYLVVSRGSKLMADATGSNRRPTAQEVIVFTSDKPKGQRDRGDWGGLIINGRASTNAGTEAQGEGDSGFYGGTDDMDNSGIIRGVRIEYAGDRVTPSDELNGIALQAVGSGTTLSYIQIHYNVDDGVEPFGGTASIDHLVVTGIGDDSVDGTDGYRGFIQFVIGQQRGDEADNGMELSNDGADANASPRSTAVVANATMIGADEDLQAGEIRGPNGDRGIQFREGSHYRVYNSIFRDFGDAGFCIENAGTVVAANNRINGATDPQTTLSFEGNVIWNNSTADAGDGNFAGCSGYTTAENKTFFTKAGYNNMVADPGLRAGYSNIGSQSSPPDIIATATPAGFKAFNLGSIATDGTNLFAPTDGRTLTVTDYPGAVAPGTALADAWYFGWTIWSVDGSDSRANHEGN